MKYLRLIALALIVIVTLSAAACGEVGEDITPLMPGDEMRDFTVNLLDGSSYKLSEKNDTVILLNFWATWCGPCVRELPAFDRLCEKYGDDLTLVAVNCGEKKADVEAFMNENGYKFNVALDEDYAVSSMYPSDGIPYTLVIGKDGIVSAVHIGASDADEMFETYSADIDKALGN